MSEECQENLSPTGNKNFHQEINIIIDSTGNEDEKLTKYEQVSKIPEINEKQIVDSSEGNVLSKETNTKTKVNKSHISKQKIRTFYRRLNRFMLKRFRINMNKLDENILDSIYFSEIDLVDLFDKRKIRKASKRIKNIGGNLYTSWKYFRKVRYKELYERYLQGDDYFPLIPNAYIKISNFPKDCS